jgi:hypothetical protein
LLVSASPAWTTATPSLLLPSSPSMENKNSYLL